MRVFFRVWGLGHGYLGFRVLCRDFGIDDLGLRFFGVQGFTAGPRYVVFRDLGFGFDGAGRAFSS